MVLRETFVLFKGSVLTWLWARVRQSRLRARRKENTRLRIPVPLAAKLTTQFTRSTAALSHTPARLGSISRRADAAAVNQPQEQTRPIPDPGEGSGIISLASLWSMILNSSNQRRNAPGSSVSTDCTQLIRLDARKDVTAWKSSALAGDIRPKRDASNPCQRAGARARDRTNKRRVHTTCSLLTETAPNRLQCGCATASVQKAVLPHLDWYLQSARMVIHAGQPYKTWHKSKNMNGRISQFTLTVYSSEVRLNLRSLHEGVEHIPKLIYYNLITAKTNANQLYSANLD